MKRINNKEYFDVMSAELPLKHEMMIGSSLKKLKSIETDFDFFSNSGILLAYQIPKNFNVENIYLLLYYQQERNIETVSVLFTSCFVSFQRDVAL